MPRRADASYSTDPEQEAAPEPEAAAQPEPEADEDSATTAYVAVEMVGPHQPGDLINPALWSPERLRRLARAGSIRRKD